MLSMAAWHAADTEAFLLAKHCMIRPSPSGNTGAQLFDVIPASVSLQLHTIESPVKASRCFEQGVVAFSADLVLMSHDAEEQSTFARGHAGTEFVYVSTTPRLELFHTAKTRSCSRSDCAFAIDPSGKGGRPQARKLKRKRISWSLPAGVDLYVMVQEGTLGCVAALRLT